MTNITVKCPQCGSSFDLETKEQLTGIIMKCAYCGKDITINNVVSINNTTEANGEYMQKPRSHKGLWFTVILVAVLAIMAFSKPDKAKHVEKIKEYCMLAVDEASKEESDLSKGIAMMIAPYILNPVIDSMPKVDDYFFFNVGKIRYSGDSKVATIGVFGNVITLISEDKIKESINEGKTTDEEEE